MDPRNPTHPFNLPSAHMLAEEGRIEAGRMFAYAWMQIGLALAASGMLGIAVWLSVIKLGEYDRLLSTCGV